MWLLWHAACRVQSSDGWHNGNQHVSVYKWFLLSSVCSRITLFDIRCLCWNSTVDRQTVTTQNFTPDCALCGRNIWCVYTLPSLSMSSLRNKPSSMETKLKLESSLSSEMYPEVRQGSPTDLGGPLVLLDLCRDWMYLAKLIPLPERQNMLHRNKDWGSTYSKKPKIISL